MNDKEYKGRFIKLGLSDQFDFIGRDYSSYRGRKIIVRCRECGTEFSTWAFDEILKGRQSHLLCPECGSASDGEDVWNRSPQCEKAMAYYVQGHTVKETAEQFGVSTVQINNAVKVRNLTNGRKWGEYNPKHNEKQRKMAIENLVEKLESEGFDYVGGYSTSKGKVTIKCRICGHRFERTVCFVKRGNLICQQCEHEKALIRQAERQEIRRIESARLSEERKSRREAERLAKNPLGLSDYQLSRRALLDDASLCKVCGKEYTLREYMESTGAKYYRNSGYCSVECRDAHNKERIKISHKGRRDSHRHRARKYDCEYDPSVTLKKLIERDGLRCKICGEMCDPDDHSWSEYTGPLSPSIDHIIPMAKSGGHIWNNVQVAHVICNSNKGDKLEEAM